MLNGTKKIRVLLRLLDEENHLGRRCPSVKVDHIFLHAVGISLVDEDQVGEMDAKIRKE